MVLTKAQCARFLLTALCITLLWSGITNAEEQSFSEQVGDGIIINDSKFVRYPRERSESVYVVPDGITTIAADAFAYCDIVEVYIPEGVTMIGASAFKGCIFLEKVHLPESLLVISNSAFSYCTQLSDIDLPPNLYAIGNYAFSDNWSLQSVVIPASVSFVGHGAFSNSSIIEIRFEGNYLDYVGDHLFTPFEDIYTTIIVPHEGLYYAERLKEEFRNRKNVLFQCADMP